MLKQVSEDIKACGSTRTWWVEMTTKEEEAYQERPKLYNYSISSASSMYLLTKILVLSHRHTRLSILQRSLQLLHIASSLPRHKCQCLAECFPIVDEPLPKAFHVDLHL